MCSIGIMVCVDHAIHGEVDAVATRVLRDIMYSDHLYNGCDDYLLRGDGSVASHHGRRRYVDGMAERPVDGGSAWNDHLAGTAHGIDTGWARRMTAGLVRRLPLRQACRRCLHMLYTRNSSLAQAGQTRA